MTINMEVIPRQQPLLQRKRKSKMKTKRVKKWGDDFHIYVIFVGVIPPPPKCEMSQLRLIYNIIVSVIEWAYEFR